MTRYTSLPQPIYISGPMTGYPNFNRDLFNRVASELRSQGIIVLNPAEIPGHDDWDWLDWMREAIKMLLFAKSVVLLPEWNLSRGASLEYEIAFNLGLEIAEWTSLHAKHAMTGG